MGNFNDEKFVIKTKQFQTELADINVKKQNDYLDKILPEHNDFRKALNVYSI